MLERLAGHISFQTSHDFGGVEPFVSATCHVSAGLLMAAHPGEDYPVEGGVGLTVASPVQPVSSGLA